MTARPDILFLILDSARKDRVSLYGHDRETTPALDALGRDATVYENAYTPTPWTLPSHCSMFTGKFPSEHGVTNGFSDRRPSLPESESTLAERLTDAGYRTAGFSNNPWVGSLSGLDRGFDEYVEWDLEIGRTDDSGITSTVDHLYSRFHTLLGQAARQPVFLLKRPFFTNNLIRRGKRWVRETTDDDAPTFTFLNLMEAHSPYFPPNRAFDVLDLDAPGPLEPRTLNTRLLAYVLGKTDLSGENRERIMEYYDAALRYEDEKVRELLETYREVGLFDDTLVIVCSDHGKTLGEFPRDSEPSHYVRAHNTNVPLVVKWPGQTRGEWVDDPVELVDLFDLVVDAASGDAATPDLGRDRAMTEDFVPHTGSRSTEVTRWRVISEEEYRYARTENGEEYLLAHGDSTTDEIVVTAESGEAVAAARRLSDALDRRVPDPGDTTKRETGEGKISGTTESQLQDLGYL